MARKKEITKSPEQQSLELKKHVAVIHSSSRITLLQRKIANALLYNAYDSLQTKDEHEIHIGSLCKLIGYDSHDHRTIKNSLVNLLSTVIEWNLVDGEKIDREGVWNASSMIADASIDGAICTYSYSNKMKKLLYRPNMYGRLNMQVQAKFQSSYGLALYENCNRYQDIGQTPWFDLMTFRRLMGVEEDKYKIFRDFKTRVLDKAVEEVNKYSPIKIDLHLRKERRKVIAIQFLIKRSDYPSQAVITREQKTELSENLKKQYGLSNKQIVTLLSQYEEHYIREKINLIESSVTFQAGKIQHLAKYLLSALKDDYQTVKFNKDKRNATVTDRNKENQSKISETIVLKNKYRSYKLQTYINYINQQSDQQQKIIYEIFAEHIKPQVELFNIYKKKGLSSAFVMVEFLAFIEHQYPHMTNECISFEKYASQSNV